MDGTTEAQSGLVEAEGALLYYEVAGAGPPLVLLHEGIADSRMYDPQWDAFAAHYRVVRYDLHGYGRSGLPEGPYQHHTALRALLDQLGIERAALLGMSMGGAIALDFALTWPKRVGALVLMAAGVGGFPPSAEGMASFTGLIEAFQQGDFERAVELTLRLWVDGPHRGPDQVDPGVRVRVREMFTEYLRRTPGGLRLPPLMEPPAIGRLGEIRAPTLVVVGEGDVHDILTQAGLLASGIAGARKVVLPVVAHVPNMELPDEVNRSVLDFLAAVYPPR